MCARQAKILRWAQALRQASGWRPQDVVLLRRSD